MNSKLTISCQCQKLIASVEVDQNKLPTRLKCYCIDCQTYIKHLKQSDHYLDELGGSDILQISPADISIKQGQEFLGNMKITPNGIYRWYATCCNSPICNTPSNANMPYVGLLNNNITKATGQPASGNETEKNSSKKIKTRTVTVNKQTMSEQLNSILGPVRFGVGAGSKHPIKAPWPVSKGFGLRGTLGTLRNIARWRRIGDHKKSVFINHESNLPTVEPVILSLQERNDARPAK